MKAAHGEVRTSPRHATNWRGSDRIVDRGKSLPSDVNTNYYNSRLTNRKIRTAAAYPGTVLEYLLIKCIGYFVVMTL